MDIGASMFKYTFAAQASHSVPHVQYNVSTACCTVECKHSVKCTCSIYICRIECKVEPLCPKMGEWK